MANVQLPNIDTVETDIKVLVSQLLNAYAKLTKELTWLLNNLDTRNVNELNAEKIVAGSIMTDKLAAGAVTADKISVNELSAITADLGHITAGLIESIEIFGSYIATRRNDFPRAEMNNSGDLLAVYTDASNYMTIEPGLFDEPTIVFRKSGLPSLVLGPVGIFAGLVSSSLSLLVGSENGSLQLMCGSDTFDNVTVPSWSKFRSLESGTSLQSELDAIWAALAGKASISHSHSVTIPNHNHGNPDNLNSGGGTFIVS
ncbi:hypothetical protein [Paenibacillus wynnii]|uniref:Uncharacterized protein n=1 Tax=Paenibacillus wynnii TaxID=268407 RepID=A0A098MDK3_9BACL|nr:hypothetical protein [Paenibacillus wynnii]KGE20061.1 hypothetical protein PWYN_12465 [Paenibacillus wynnii]